MKEMPLIFQLIFQLMFYLTFPFRRVTWFSMSKLGNLIQSLPFAPKAAAGLLGLLLVVGILFFGASCEAATTYTYDNLGRLTVVNYGSGTSISYSYDAAGNRQTRSIVVPPTITAQSGTPQITVVSTAFSLALKVRVADSLGNGTSGATVVFTPPGSGASASCAIPVATDANGLTQTTCTANGVAGSYLVNATVTGIAIPAIFALTNYQGATGTPTQLGTSANPSIYKTNITLTVTVTGNAPTGFIDFQDGGISISGCSAQPVVSGQATCQTAALTLGTHGLTAIYSGDGQNLGGSSSILPQAVYSLFDVDANGQIDALTDGLLIIRHMSGLNGTPLINGVIGMGAQRTTGPDIETYLVGAGLLFDVDGDNQLDPLTDGLIIMRYLFGLRGAPLIQGAVGSAATRTTAQAIEAYISGLLP